MSGNPAPTFKDLGPEGQVLFPTLILCQRWGKRATGEQAAKISDYKSLSKADESSGTAESQPQHFWTTNWKVWGLTVLAQTIHFMNVRTLCSLDRKPEKKATEGNGTTVK